MRHAAAFVLLLLCLAFPASAHEVRPAYLEITETAPLTHAVTWKQPVLDGKRLRLTPILPDSCAAGPETQTIVAGALVTRWETQCDLSVGDITIDGLTRTLTDVFVRVTDINGETRSGVLRPASPTLNLGSAAANASPAEAYFRIGVEHIIFGYDHLLFVIGVVLLVRLRQLLVTITAFTVGHSITLALAALTSISLPQPPIEILIALSIAFLAAEAIGRAQGRETLATKYPWGIAAGFGLIHGFGFAGALADIGLPPSAERAALLLFNLGVEVGQIFCVAALLAAGWALSKISATALPPVRTLTAYAIGCIGAFWAIERITASLSLL